MNKEKYTAMIKNRAAELGFISCGISKAEFLEDEAPRLEEWLNNGYHAEMGYMENHFDKRLDPTKLVPGAKSVISLLYNYYPAEQQIDDTYKISKYAYGQDYHYVIKAKMRELFHYIEEEIGAIEGRYFVDSAPVLDKAWAARSGLGWIGKHTLMLSKQKGSFFFVSEIICDLELEYDSPTTDHCGTCTACIDACPTSAIIADRVVDANKCISYLTIELRDALPSYMDGQMQDWIFGCDICQDVCPWNRFSKAHQEPLFNPHPDLLSMNKEDWVSLDEDRFQELFRKSAVKRTKYSGLTRNIDFVSKSENDNQKD
ncbi:MAG TPA: tRNA epoxyqueuosine(34) reductase QueG [Flavobacteriaceae bacterium]|nr:tRNA epoxyqueuosine(34) reductase QueG [Flavobacteriaceae bacterium]